MDILPNITYCLWFVGIIASLTLRFRRSKFGAVRGTKTLSVPSKDAPKLFPAMGSKDKSTSSYDETSLLVESSTEPGPQPCSTGLTTRLLPFKNDKGEIEWVFSDDIVPGKELDAFKVSPFPISKSPLSLVSKQSVNHSPLDLSNDLSPVTSASSNGDSLSEKRTNLSVLQIHTPSSSSSEDHKEDENDLDEDHSAETGDGDQVHQCSHCPATFRIRGYLTRHMKKHSVKKAYQCPFHEKTAVKNDSDGAYKCHPTGAFSRRDTYKSHLKSRHFRYPRGTSTKDRNLSPGSCGMCGEWFQNAEIWTEIHIEGAECKCLPVGFKGKSRIKNKLKKQMARLIKEQRQLANPNVNCGTLVDQQSPVFATPSSTVTPIVMSSTNDYNSPAPSIFSSARGTPLTSELTQYPKFNPLLNLQANPLMQSDNELRDNNYLDYDDEFCLDTEQMSVPLIPIHQNHMMHHNNGLYADTGLHHKMGHVMSQYSH